MTKQLLILVAGGALVCFVSFSLLNIVGGFHGPPWRHGMVWSGTWDDRAVGPDVTRDLPWTGGDRLDIGYPAEITFTQGPQAKFTVTGPKGLVDVLRMDGDALDTPDDTDDFPFFMHHHSHRRLKITITGPSLHEFHMSGAEKLTLVNFDQDSLILHCSGAADVRGQGKAKRLEAHVSGAGHLDLGDLPIDDAEVSFSGAGDATLDPKTSAEISISGAGHVKLKTKPANLQTHISGFGSVETP